MISNLFFKSMREILFDKRLLINDFLKKENLIILSIHVLDIYKKT